MTATIRDIRRRIQSVENVKQITKAMQMVAVARLHKAEQKAEQSHQYAEKIKQMLRNLAMSSENTSHPFFASCEVKKIAVVVVSGDKGLCGAYNTYVFSAADKFLKKHDSQTVEVIPIGKKAVSYYQKKPWKIRHSVEEWGGKISFHDVKLFANQLVDWFLSHEFDEIWLIYTHFVTIASREVVTQKFLNIAVPKTEKKPQQYIFEPNSAEIYNELLPRYCISTIQTMLDEAYASELAARAFAMKKATTSAEEMIVSLTLLRNKLRQSAITREMIEITSGAESIK